MRTAALTALAIFALATPASAQMMCGPGQSQQAQAPGGMMGGMCGMGQATAQDPMAEKKPEQTQRGGMCSCCRNMAMMRGGGMGGMGGMPHHNMPGMEAPKQ